MLKQSVTHRVMTRVILGLLVAFGVSSCGSTSNSDQGTIFTLLGIFNDNTCGTAVSEFSVPLGDIITEANDSATSAFGGGLQVGMSVQNNLAAQGLRVDSANLSYEIPGASAQPPSTVVALNAQLGPSGGDGTISSSLPISFLNIPNFKCAFASGLPAAVESWIILNKESLPEAPFTMIVEATASGVTTAGDRISSNSQFFTIVFTPGTVVPATGAGN